MNLRRGIALFRGQREFHMDIVGKRRIWFAISGTVIVISLLALAFRGLNLGIDFEGGALLNYANESGASVEEIRGSLADHGHPEAIVQLTGEGQVSVRTESLGADRTELLGALAEGSGIEPSDVSIQDIGPKWGQQISAKAIQGLVIFLIAVSIYISFRFEWKMAVSALVAMVHDIIVTAGVYALIGLEVTPETVIALLTILGYSLYDTVVIFDKIKENTESLALVARETYAGTVNLSLNQVFMRSVNTTVVALLPVGSLMFFGGDTLQSFAFALFIGMLTGAYSSIFLGAPLVAILKEREPKLAEIRERAGRRETRPALQAAPADKDRELVAAAAPRPSTQSRPGAARRRPKKKPRSKRRKS
ncbi:MAG: protein translocase subunit SecF [Actinomycetota bacterium]